MQDQTGSQTVLGVLELTGLRGRLVVKGEHVQYRQPTGIRKKIESLLKGCVKVGKRTEVE